jgi:LPS-assembly lipoprotein
MSNRRELITGVVASVLLSGCGYRPLYARKGDGSDVATKLAGISIAEQRTRTGQLVRNELLSSMSPPGSGEATRFFMTLVIHETVVGVSHLPSSPLDRKRFNLSVAYVLGDSNRKTVNRGSSQASVAFDTVRQPIADLQARDTAMQKAAIEVAQDIKLRLAAFLSA